MLFLARSDIIIAYYSSCLLMHLALATGQSAPASMLFKFCGFGERLLEVRTQMEGNEMELVPCSSCTFDYVNLLEQVHILLIPSAHFGPGMINL